MRDYLYVEEVLGVRDANNDGGSNDSKEKALGDGGSGET